MSIILTELFLQSNQAQIDQNDPLVVNALLKDQFGNPVPNVEVSIYVTHPDYGTSLLFATHATDHHGKARFEIVLRNLGKSEIIVQSGTLTSSPIDIRVFASPTITGPTSWPGVVRSMGRFGIDLNTVVGQEIARGHHPTKAELCALMGLDYSLANDRNKIRSGLNNMKLTFDYIWRVLYERSPSYGRDFARFMRDLSGYDAWKVDANSPYRLLRTQFRLDEDDIHQLWVTSKMWDVFVATANQYNIHLFVAYYDVNSKSHRYIQPSIWEYVIKQIQSGSHWAKALRTILTRHRDLGMILTSGEPVYKVLEVSENTRKMITEQASPKFRCPMCSDNGHLVQFRGTDEYFAHIKQMH